MRPVAWQDLADLRALKADPQVFAVMLGGVRTPARTAEELAEDTAFWARHNVGMWSVRDAETDGFVGITGFMQRPDGRGIALRFALWPEARGRGLAREAAGAALYFAHDRAGLERVIAVARESNFGSRMVLGSIGMVVCDSFWRDGDQMLVYESCRRKATETFPVGSGRKRL